ncbi:MAG: DUF4783 domain-containing protein [Catalinimonas sp.]
MRKHVLLFASLFGLVLTAAGQSDKVLDSVMQSLRSGDARALTSHLNESVELGFDGQKSTYGRTQAEFVLRDFMKKHPPTGFEFVHRGASKDGIRYCIGKYAHAGGVYRVMMLVKPTNGSYRIDMIDFSRE